MKPLQTCGHTCIVYLHPHVSTQVKTLHKCTQKIYNLVKLILLLSQYMAILLVNNVTYQFPLQILVFISFINSEITFIFPLFSLYAI